jgi:hypothetical protein
MDFKDREKQSIQVVGKRAIEEYVDVFVQVLPLT